MVCVILLIKLITPIFESCRLDLILYKIPSCIVNSHGTMNYFLPLSSSRIMNGLEVKVNTNVSFRSDGIPHDLMKSPRICPRTRLAQPWLITQVLEWGHQQAMLTCDLYVTWNVLFCICAVLFQGQRDCRGTTFLSLLRHSCQSSSRSSVVFLFVFDVC